MESKSALLFVVTQHGSFNVVYPVLKACYGKHRIGYIGLKDIQENGLMFNRITSDGFKLDSRDLDGFDVFITGTSPDGTVEYEVWEYVREKKKKSIAILDLPKHCIERFMKGGKYLFPDALCVPDERSKNELIELGMDNNRIFVTGSPYLEAVGNSWLSPEEKEATRLMLGLGDKKAIFFCTEYIAKENEGEKYGYDEIVILEHIVDYIKTRGVGTFRLFIKLHPKDDNVVYKTRMGLNSEIDYHVVSEDAGNIMLQVADVVIGMTSTILVESSILGLRVISYQPASDMRQVHVPHDTIRKNLVLSKEELYKKLDSILIKHEGTPTCEILIITSGAVGKIVAVIEKVLSSANCERGTSSV